MTHPDYRRVDGTKRIELEVPENIHSPYLRFLAECLRKGYLFAQPNSKTGELIMKLAEKFFSESQFPTPVELEETENFNWQETARRMTQMAIGMVWRMNILRKETKLAILNAATGFYGPGNLTVTSEQIAYVNEEYKIQKKGFLERRIEDLSVPTNRAERHKRFKFCIGQGVVRNYAALVKEACDKESVQADTDLIFSVATLIIAAHEYGHAIDRALLAKGIKTYSILAHNRQPGPSEMPSEKEYVSFPMEMITKRQWLDNPTLEESPDEFVHAERVARGLEDECVALYLVLKLGWDRSVVDRVLWQLREIERENTEDLRRFYEFWKKIDSKSQIKWQVTEEYLNKLLSNNKKFLEFADNSIPVRVAYNFTPYTLEELQILFNDETHEETMQRLEEERKLLLSRTQAGSN